MKKILLAAGMIALASGTAHAATATGSAKATVVAPLAITHTNAAALDFGTFTAGTGGQIAITAAASPTTTPSGGVAFVSGNTNSADSFSVTGDTTRSFNVSFGGPVTVSTAGPTPATMSFSPTGVSSAALTAGAYTLYVGGTLTVGANQTAGAYTGTYSVTVTYQ